MRLQIVLILLALPLLSACAEFTHLTRVRPLDTSTKPHVVLIDAKQRAVIASRPSEVEIVTNTTSGNTTRTETTKVVDRFCAEPSPDALSALAASQGLSLSKKDVADLTQSSSISEGASSIGLRTQSIQLMRDAMYRLCEGYLSGSLSPASYQSLFRRFQNSMVAILAIEQLTGVQRAPAVSIGSDAVIGAAELAAKYTELTEQARQSVREAEETQGKEETKLADAAKAVEDQQEAKAKKEGEVQIAKNVLAQTTAPGDGASAAEKEKYAALEKAITDKGKELSDAEKKLAEMTKSKNEAESTLEATQTTISEKKALLESYNSARLAALGGSGSSSVTVKVVIPEESSRTISDKAVQAIAKAVGDIVETTFEQDFSVEACASVINGYSWGQNLKENSTSGDVTPNSIAAACVSYIEAQTKRVTAEIDGLEAARELTLENDTLGPDQKLLKLEEQNARLKQLSVRLEPNSKE